MNSYSPIILPFLLPSFMGTNEDAMQKTSQDGKSKECFLLQYLGTQPSVVPRI